MESLPVKIKALKKPEKKPNLIVRFLTFGCTLNKADTNEMKAYLSSLKNVMVVDSHKKSISSPLSNEVVVINTCAVKEATENKELFLIKELAKKGKKLVIAGCLTYNEKLIRKYAKNAVLVSPTAIDKIGLAISYALQGKAATIKEIKRLSRKAVIVNGVISPLAIQQGCTEHCSYCATKLARPLLFSLRPRRVYELAKLAISKGAKEIQLTGMDLGAYGLEIKVDLSLLLLELPKQAVYRVGMLHPKHAKRMLPSLISSYLSSPVYKFLHLPVQSGSNNILKLMARDYSVEEVLEIIKRFREKVKELTIATDVIVGFPGEEEEDFEQTLSFLEKAQVDVVNSSRFSPRPLTKAFSFPRIDNKIVKKRTVYLHSFLTELLKKRNEKYLGKLVRVLITEPSVSGFKGRTVNYKQVIVKDSQLSLSLGDVIEGEVEGITRTSLVVRPERKLLFSEFVDSLTRGGDNA